MEVAGANIPGSYTRVPHPMPNGIAPLGHLRCKGWALVMMLRTGGSEEVHSSAAGPSSLPGGPPIVIIKEGSDRLDCNGFILDCTVMEIMEGFNLLLQSNRKGSTRIDNAGIFHVTCDHVEWAF